MSKKRRTPEQKSLIERLRSGQKLRAQIGDPPYFIDGGETVNRRTVLCLVRDGILKPADALFEGFPQSYELVA